MKEININKLRQLKKDGNKIVMVTAYDYSAARLADAAGVDVILVGDSLGMVMLGYGDTLSVTMADMLHHTKAVSRGVDRAMVISDMPFLSYQIGPEQALLNAGRFLQEAGAQAVKLEGGSEVTPMVAKITAAGIPVFGHLGFTPQAVNQLGGAIYQGKTAGKAVKLVDDALRLEDAGICSVVLELIPWEVAALITERLQVPTIGIGSGPACDGQVLVYHDLLGLNLDFSPKHGRIFREAGKLIKEALGDYANSVRAGQFPTDANTKHLAEGELEELTKNLALKEGDRPWKG